MNPEIVLETQLVGLGPPRRGKVRDIYELGNQLLIVSTDRISAFDWVLPNGIPHKGRILTQLSAFWFRKLSHLVSNHLLSSRLDEFPEALHQHRGVLAGRSMLVKRTKVIPIECVVRGYLAGSGWKEYQKAETVCGIRLPKGLLQCSPLPRSLFTPATKAESGHDLNISEAEMGNRIGSDLTKKLRDISLKIYTEAANYALACGIIIADTKFEFGLDENGTIIWIDEALTPDSSRFWPISRPI
jgi:phosphoribosylaminoimidazole-succinocarboxamide synthase